MGSRARLGEHEAILPQSGIRPPSVFDVDGRRPARPSTGPKCDDIEAQIEACEIGPCGKEGRGRPRQASALAGLKGIRRLHEIAALFHLG